MPAIGQNQPSDMAFPMLLYRQSLTSEYEIVPQFLPEVRLKLIEQIRGEHFPITVKEELAAGRR